MSEEIKTGWLKERDGTKFAPKTLISQVVTNDGYNYDQVVKAQMSNLKNELGANTKEDIAALKTSLNALQDKVDNISLDELVSADNRLYIVDNAGYKIAEIDAEGIHSVNFIIPESGDLKSLTEVLDIVDDKTFYIVDDKGLKIFEINSSGANSVDFLINGKSVKDSLASILTDISGLREAINNVFTSESDKSIEIIDGKENIIAKIDSAGIHSVDFTAYKAKEKVEGAEGTEYDTLTLWEVNDIINDVKQEIEEVKQTITSNDVIEQLQKDVDALETTTSGHGDQLKVIDEKIDFTDTPEESFDIVDKDGYKIASFDKTGLNVTNLNVGGNGDDVGTVSADKVYAGDIELSELGNKFTPFEESFEFEEDVENLEIVNNAGRVLATINAGGITAADFLINKDGKVTSIATDISGLKAKVDTLGLPESLSNSNTAFGRIKRLEEKTHNISVNGDETIIGRLKIDENDGVSVVVNANSFTAGIGIFANNITKPFTSLTWQGLTVCDPRETETTETSITANKISTTGTISANEVETNNWAVGGEEFSFTDGTEQNNIIAKIDANGITTTNLNAKKIYINSRDLASTIPVMVSGKIPQSTTTAIKGQSGTNRRALTFDFMPHTIILFKEPEVTNSVDAKNSQLPIIWTKVKDDPMGYKDFVSYNLNGSTGAQAVEGSLEWGQNYVAWTSSFEDSAIPTGATCTFSSNLFCDGTYYYIAYGNALSEDGNKLSTPITTLTQTNMW